MSGFFGFLAVASFVAFIVGLIKPDWVVFWTKKKSRGAACLYLAAVLLFAIISGMSGESPKTPMTPTGSSPAASSEFLTSSPPSSTAQSSAAPSSSTPATKAYTATLLPGYYEVGTDIPAGTYDFEIASGRGNVVDIDDGINLIMGNSSEEMYQKGYKNAKLTEGSTLMLSQCSIKISSQNASTNLKKRDNSSAQAFNITSSGNYEAGKDFQPGYYDIELASGSGNVICPENELNAVMSKDSSFGVTVYKNVKFENGYTLDVEGPKLRLTPSK